LRSITATIVSATIGGMCNCISIYYCVSLLNTLPLPPRINTIPTPCLLIAMVLLCHITLNVSHILHIPIAHITYTLFHITTILLPKLNGIMTSTPRQSLTPTPYTPSSIYFFSQIYPPPYTTPPQ
jgi:hypothetical protein